MEHQTKSDHDPICGRVLLLDDAESRITYLRNVLEFVDYSLEVLGDVSKVEEYLQADSYCTAVMLTPAISNGIIDIIKIEPVQA